MWHAADTMMVPIVSAKDKAKETTMSKKAFTVSMEDLEDGRYGICLMCGHEQYGVEPDAEGYTCEDCKMDTVYGMEQAALMGRVEIEYSDDDDGGEW